MSFRDDYALFGECKWVNALVDTKVLYDLMEKSRLFHYKNNYLYLFAKRGFTEKCIKTAEQLNDVFLVKFEDM